VAAPPDNHLWTTVLASSAEDRRPEPRWDTEIFMSAPNWERLARSIARGGAEYLTLFLQVRELGALAELE